MGKGAGGYGQYLFVKCRCNKGIVINKKLIFTGTGGEVTQDLVNWSLDSTIIRTATANGNDCWTRANRPTNVYKSWAGAPAGYGQSPQNTFN